MMDSEIEDWVREINADRDSELPDQLVPPASRLHAMHGRLPSRRRGRRMRAAAVAACVLVIGVSFATRQRLEVGEAHHSAHHGDVTAGPVLTRELQRISLPDGLSLRVASIDLAQLDAGFLTDPRAFRIQLGSSDLLLPSAADLTR